MLKEPLTIEYRPQTFSEVVGQNHVVPVLRAFVLNNVPPPVLIFSGETGVAKTTLARVYAAALNCFDLQSNGDPCTVCESCVAIRNNASLLYLEVDSATSGNVEGIRKVKESLSHYYTEGMRVIAFDEAHAITNDAFNSMLTLLEQPPPNTCFLLITTNPSKIPKTIQGRSVQFDFRIVPVDLIEKRLLEVAQAEGVDIPKPLISLIATSSKGHVRNALMDFDKCLRSNITTVEEYQTISQDFDISYELLSAIATNNHQLSLEAVDTFFENSSDLDWFLTSILTRLIELSKAYYLASDDAKTVSLSNIVSKDKTTVMLDVMFKIHGAISYVTEVKPAAQLAVTALFNSVN